MGAGLAWGQKPGSGPAHLVEFDRVPGRIGQKSLEVRGDGTRVGDLEASIPQLRDGGADVGYLHREVLAEVGRRRSFDEVELLTAEVDPSAAEPEIGSIGAEGAAEDVGVERS